MVALHYQSGYGGLQCSFDGWMQGKVLAFREDADGKLPGLIS